MLIYISQFSFSYPGGEPPTPTKTPTSPNFFLNSFQTPKQDSRSHGPYSPWSPVFPSATNAEFKTPTRLSFTTPTQTPIDRHSTGLDLETEIASHVHHLSPNPNLPLPPVEQAKQLSSSPNLCLTSKSGASHFDSAEPKAPKPTLDTSVGASINSAGSMQTPPPTSTSMSRREVQQAQVAKLIKYSTEKAKRMALFTSGKNEHLGVSNSQVGESPQQFSALEFSPEGFGFPMSGAATAPVYPQHKLFWDPEQGSDTLNMDFAMDDSFAAFGMQKNLDPFTSAEDLGSGVQFPTSPDFNLLNPSNDNLAAFPSTFPESPSRTATSMTMARNPSRGHAVNPSLLFSSPSRADEVSNTPHTAQAIQDDILKPYSIQLRDAQLEMEMENARRPKRKRGPESGDSPAVKAAIETLREDGVDRAQAKDDLLTVGQELNTKRSKSRNSFGSANDDRTGAPLPLHKQRSRTNLMSASNNSQAYKRTSITLTIDASGRAKTQTKIMDEARPPSRMDVDSDDNSDTSSSSSSTGMVMSQPQSFAYPQSNQKQPSLGRFTSDSKSHSQKSSYTSTKGSSATSHTRFDPAEKRRQSNLYMLSEPQKSQRSHRNIIGEEGGSEAETVIDTDEDRGDAQSELKKIMRSRSSHKKNTKRGTRPESKNTITDQRRIHQTQQFAGGPYYTQNSITPAQRGYNDRYSNISPTTITDPDLTTPSTGHSNLSSDSVRCRCQNSHDDGRLMIQW